MGGIRLKMTLAAALVIGLVSFESKAQWVRIDEKTIQLDGEIGRDSYQSYLDVAKGGYSSVILRSTGGAPVPALMIARDMQARLPKISVKSHCFSACANYLLMASPAPRVECGALVIWHGSPIEDWRLRIKILQVEQADPEFLARYEAWTERFASMEQALFAGAGVSGKLLLDSVVIVEREGLAPKSNYSFDEMTGDYAESTTAGMWIPTREVMQDYGIDTRDVCRNYNADIPIALRRLGISAPYTSAGP